MVKSVAVIHYMPLEIYPPVMNLVKTWNQPGTRVPMYIYTTRLANNSSLFQPDPAHTTIYRFGDSGNAGGLIKRLWRYLHYYLATIFMLLKTRPGNVLYFDTISSFPAIVYKLVRGNRCSLFVHYNEYMSPAEYSQGMFLVRWFHKLEKRLYAATAWLSHTNQERMDLFKADLPGIDIPNAQVMPNFPPADWNKVKQPNYKPPVKIVYTGALSMDTMYTRLFAEWVLQQQGAAVWHIYSLNSTPEAETFINSLPVEMICLKNGVDYYQLPEILEKYDAGVILYNGHIPNYVFNAPNKLFEYAATGLDVWFPDHMQSSRQYITVNTYPKIVALDFQQLNKLTAAQLTDKTGLAFLPHPFSCEPALMPLLNKLGN